MSKKKTAVQIKHVRFSAKFISTLGGRVRLKGGYNGDIPDSVDKVLQSYGLCEAPAGDEYTDIIKPDVELEDSLLIFADYMTVKYSTPKDSEFTFTIEDIDGASKVNPGSALDNAFKAWNKAGRPINGVLLQSALNRVVASENRKRGFAPLKKKVKK